MQYQKTDNAFVICLSKGEDVISSLTSFAKEHDISNAHFSAIGAVEFVSCGYYALDEQTYHFKQYDQLVEVASATGNIMLKDGEPFVHLHAVFTDTDNTAFGGHVEEMQVGVTLEVILTPLASSLERSHDADIGLHLINCPS